MQELLLREDNYNNHFANGGKGKQMLSVNRASSSALEVADWMLKKRPSASSNSSFRRTASIGPGKGGRPTRSGSAFGADTVT
jgi:hypothetical protein